MPRIVCRRDGTGNAAELELIILLIVSPSISPAKYYFVLIHFRCIRWSERHFFKFRSVPAASRRSMRGQSLCPNAVPPNEFNQTSQGTLHNRLKAIDHISSSHLHSAVSCGCNRQTDNPLDHIIIEVPDNSVAQI